MDSTGAGTFAITDTKLYLPVVTLSTQHNTKHLKQLKLRYKRTVNWNKKSNKSISEGAKPISELFDLSKFSRSQQIFVLKFEDNTLGKEATRYFLPNVESKGYNLLIDKRNDFDQPDIKIWHKNIDKIKKVVTGQGNNCTLVCLLNYQCFKENYNLIVINPKNQQALNANQKTIQQINFKINLKCVGNTTILLIV